MKQIYILLIIMFFLSNGNKINAQTEWTGALTTFTKADGADWTLAANQDQITSNVSITRANNRGLFNIVLDSQGGEDGGGPQPSDTEWAFGDISDGVGTLTFTTWGQAHDTNPGGLVNQDMVVHLITDDIYIDIKLLSWSSGGMGGMGGFSYERSTDQTLSTNEFELENSIKLFPNPSSELIQVSGLIEGEKYILYNILGARIKDGIIYDNQQIDIRDCTNGLYFMKFDNVYTLKFIKN